MRRTPRQHSESKRDIKWSVRSKAVYAKLYQASNFFNQTLFGDELPETIITLNHKNPRLRGYFSRDRFKERMGNDRISEISLNPQSMNGRSDKEILSTLVHELCHLWQFRFGKPSRRGYHNREWGIKMDEVGLVPSDTGKKGGKKTGQQMSHYIKEGGPFDMACNALLSNGWKLDWEAPSSITDIARKRQSKTKYTCESCCQNAWAKPNSKLICGDCKKEMKEVSR